MKLQSSHFTAPVVFVVLSFLAGCSSDTTSGGSGGTSAGGHPGSGGTSAGGSAPAAGGVGTGGSAPSTGASFATVKGIIAKSCFGNGCHGQEGNPLQMKVDDSLYTTLTTHVTANCGPLVNKASPAESALVTILQKDCGTAKKTERMPYQSCFEGDTPEDNPACIPTADVAAIQSWIASGAPM